MTSPFAITHQYTEEAYAWDTVDWISNTWLPMWASHAGVTYNKPPNVFDMNSYKFAVQSISYVAYYSSPTILRELAKDFAENLPQIRGACFDLLNKSGWWRMTIVEKQLPAEALSPAGPFYSAGRNCAHIAAMKRLTKGERYRQEDIESVCRQLLERPARRLA